MMASKSRRSSGRDAAGPRLGLLLQIEARAEAAAGAGKHDGAHAFIGLGRVHGAVQLAQHGGIHGIHALRPVQGDQRDGAAALGEERFVGHDRRSSPRHRLAL
jgi:hypothetical protein